MKDMFIYCRISLVMMTKKKIFITMVLFLLSLTLLRIGWIFFYNYTNQPQARTGVLDLRAWDTASKHPISLNGEWEFYSDHFLQYDESETSSKVSVLVPGNWKESLSGNQRSAEGYGSYRLRILVNPEENRTYSIQVPRIYSSSELFVNGDSLYKSGQPATTKEHYSAKITPYTVTFSSDQPEIEIMIHVANYDNMFEGGITQSIRFGTGAAVSNEQTLTMSLQMMMAVIFLIHAIYVVTLYITGFRQKSLIYLLLALLFTVAITLVDDSQLLFQWIPMNFNWTMKIFALSYIGNALFLFQYLKFILREYTIFRSFRWLTIVNLAFMIFALLAPTKYLLASMPLFYAIYIPTFLCMPFLAMGIALRNSKDALLLVLVASALTTNVIWGVIKNLGIFNYMMYYPFDLMIALITFASYWFRQFVQTSRQTEQLAEKLQMADKRKDDFLANTSHELRTPLHGMINIAQQLLEEERSTLKQQSVHNLELLLTVGQRMSHTIHDLLDLSQLKDGRIHLKLRSIRVQSVASGVVDMLKFMTEGKRISLTMDIPDSFPPVLADEKRLIQVLYNLVHNAIKFTHEGTISIHGDWDDGLAYINVTDTGIGMDEELMNRAFQAYEQGICDASTSIGGIGLGLSICRQIIQLHGGSLNINSEQGFGSTFTITLKRSEHNDAEAFEVRHTSSENEVAAGNKSQSSVIPPLNVNSNSKQSRILIVDDDVVNLKVLGDILSTYDYEVVRVTTGEEAIDKVDSEKWDLIITDVMMPQISGYELTRIIRQRYSISELPILLLTARSTPEDINTGFIAGANDYVTKPINAFEFIPRVKALTHLKHSIGQRLRLEAAYLQAQIKPHFLFNTLNSITALSDHDLPRMNDLIEAFSSYLRISFDFWNSQEFVPIKHEFELVHSYLFIQKQRFEDRLNFTCEIQPDIHVLIPPLTIQPLVENAVRHGVLSRSKGGTVLIRVIRQDHHIEISVEDNGVGMDEQQLISLLDLHEDDQRGIGLLNTDRRLKQWYREGLQIWSEPDQGTKVSFRVPLKDV